MKWSLIYRIPDSPHEPDLEIVAQKEPKVIPLDEVIFYTWFKGGKYKIKFTCIFLFSFLFLFK